MGPVYAWKPQCLAVQCSILIRCDNYVELFAYAVCVKQIFMQHIFILYGYLFENFKVRYSFIHFKQYLILRNLLPEYVCFID